MAPVVLFGRLAFLRFVSPMLVCVPLLLSGCRDEPEIVVQKIARPEALPAKDQMLAAVVPIGGKGWFFKLAGPKDLVAPEAKKFRGLLETLSVKDGKPEWTCPDGWREKPGREMRAATFEIGDGETKLECSVIPLPADNPQSDDYLLSNVNRWRDQLGIAKLSLDELKNALSKGDELGQLKLKDGTEVTWVNLSGSLKNPSGGMAPFAGRGPFSGDAPFAGGPMAGGLGAGPPTAPVGPAGPPGSRGPNAGGDDTPNSPTSIPEMTFEVPEGWSPGRINAFRKIAWKVKDGDQQLEIYISTSGGDLVGNVNRWRTQVELEPLDERDLKASLEEMRIGGRLASFMELKGPKQTTIGAIVLSNDGPGWFFKLNGDPALAEREKAGFRRFLESVKFQ